MSYPNAQNDETARDAKVIPAHTEAEEEQLELLYAQLKPEAVQVYLNYFLARTPAHLQLDMQDLIKDDISVPPTPPPEAGRRGDEGRLPDAYESPREEQRY